MRRSLVLGDESAHHPFRQSLPPHVLGARRLIARAEQDPVAEPTRIEHLAEESADLLRRQGHAMRHTMPYRLRAGLRRMWAGVKAAPKAITMQDARDFLLAYCACFVAVSAFIA